MNGSITYRNLGHTEGIADGKPTKKQTVSKSFTWSEGDASYQTFTFSNLSSVVGITKMTRDSYDYFFKEASVSGNKVTFYIHCREHDDTTINISITAIGY